MKPGRPLFGDGGLHKAFIEALVSAVAKGKDIPQEKVTEIIRETIPKGAEVIKRSLLKNAPQMLRERRREEALFRGRLGKVWKRPFDLFQALCVMSHEIGSDYNNLHRKPAARRRDVAFEALIRLHAQGTLIAHEVLTLTRAGLASGAMARWRALHETTAVAHPAEFVYEAGPCGYDAHRHITKLGYACTVIAPALTPVRPGDRVKTDVRDAEKLARLHRAGELTAIRVPTCEEEAARDLVRIREDAVEDLQRARHRLVKFLLRQGRIFREAGAWTQKHEQWLRGQKFEWPNLQQTFVGYLRAYDEVQARLKTLNMQVEDLAQQPQYNDLVRALMCLKGIGTLSAVTLIVETQDFRRFRKARQFMSYVGVVSSEHSSGNRIRRGSITRTGNAHIRRVLVEAAWSSRHAGTSAAVAKRREGCPDEIVQIAKRAQDRLHRKFWRMAGRGKRV